MTLSSTNVFGDMRFLQPYIYGIECGVREANIFRMRQCLENYMIYRILECLGVRCSHTLTEIDNINYLIKLLKVYLLVMRLTARLGLSIIRPLEVSREPIVQCSMSIEKQSNQFRCKNITVKWILGLLARLQKYSLPAYHLCFLLIVLLLSVLRMPLSRVCRVSLLCILPFL